MFGLLRNLYKWYKSKNEKIVKFALIGIDNAGKTTILARIKGEVPEFITPTIGFASETVEQGQYHIKIFDLGGGANIRTIWSSYYAEIHGAIFVVDSADKNRLATAREVLHAALDHPRLKKKPLLIFSNKQDLPAALPSPEVSEELALNEYTDYSYSCTAVLAQDGGLPDHNISEGLKWLLNTVDRQYLSLEKRIQADVAEQAEQDRIEKEEKRKRIEAMRRERELERERQEKEEASNKDKENQQSEPNTQPTEWQPPGASQSIIEIHQENVTPRTMPPDGISMTRDDFRPSPPISPVSSMRKSLSRMGSPRATATVAPLPNPARGADAPAPDAVAFTPRSAWSSTSHVPTNNTPKRKLEPLTLPSPSLQNLP